MNVVVTVNVELVKDSATFHDIFAKALGFPSFYGRNMDAWIDCMTDIDDVTAGMSKVTVDLGSVLTLQLEGVDAFARNSAEQFTALLDATAFVNWRRIERGQATVLALSYYRNPNPAPPNSA
jgi:RNAse (barnase) inhibitor barstar